MTRVLRRTGPGFSAVEAAEIHGITYRILDYWLRTGVVRIEHATPGSGRGRRFTEDEMRKLGVVVARYRKAQAELAAVRSGEVWEAA